MTGRQKRDRCPREHAAQRGYRIKSLPLVPSHDHAGQVAVHKLTKLLYRTGNRFLNTVRGRSESVTAYTGHAFEPRTKRVLHSMLHQEHGDQKQVACPQRYPAITFGPQGTVA